MDNATMELTGQEIRGPETAGENIDIIDVSKYYRALSGSYIKRLGRVSKSVGLTIESIGPDVNIGETCNIKANKYAEPVIAEVVGFGEGGVLLYPFGSMDGIGPGSIVEALGRPLDIKVSDQLLGRALNGIGEPMDGKGPLPPGETYSTINPPPNPLTRQRIKEPMPLGIKAIDGLLTVGRGQRIGIFAGSGVGKSTLLGMIARNTKADVNVISLVGERGREVREFIEKDLGEEGLARSVLVIATSDQPALVRVKAAEVGTAIAEYFRSKGKNVLFLMDSLTRFAMAQREVGLSTGEPPISRGYPPSVLALMPKLCERAGNSDRGSITGIYSVLVDGDDMTELITDAARSILDGHIVLNRKIANRNHYPAIDVLASVSRVMPDVTTPEHRAVANGVRKHMEIYAGAEDFITIGAYVRGSSGAIDEAIDLHEDIDGFLRQTVEEKYSFGETIKMMKSIVGDMG